jgi:hypothetical protein
MELPLLISFVTPPPSCSRNPGMWADLIRGVIEVKLHPFSMNEEFRFILNQSWKTPMLSTEERNQVMVSVQNPPKLVL